MARQLAGRRAARARRRRGGDRARRARERSIANSVSYARRRRRSPASLDELAGAYDGAGVERLDRLGAGVRRRDDRARSRRAGHSFDGQPLAMVLELDRLRAARARRPRLGRERRAGDESAAVNDVAYGFDARRRHGARVRRQPRASRRAPLPGPRRRRARLRARRRSTTTAATSASTSSPPHPDHRGRGLATPADGRRAGRGPRARPARPPRCRPRRWASRSTARSATSAAFASTCTSAAQR